MAKHQGGPLKFLNDIGNRKGFSRAGHAEQSLVSVTTLNSLYQASDCRRLVAGGLEFACEVEFRHMSTLYALIDICAIMIYKYKHLTEPASTFFGGTRMSRQAKEQKRYAKPELGRFFEGLGYAYTVTDLLTGQVAFTSYDQDVAG